TWDSFCASVLGPARNDVLFKLLLAAGALAGLIERRLCVALGAAIGAAIITLPMTHSGDSGILVLHRFVPVCGLQAIAAGLGGFWLADLVTGHGRHRALAASIAASVFFYLFALHRSELSVRYAFNEEFELLRRELAPGGVANTDCTLLAFSGRMDSGLHSAGQVLPGMKVLDCWTDACRAAAERGGCVYYFRSVSCYLLDQPGSVSCRTYGTNEAGDLLPCLQPACADLERALHLSQVASRQVYPRETWSTGEMSSRYPARALIGLYRVSRQ
ncbi:MAG: hypothetical protein ACRD3J_24075, partial [Thermoanaerobaculia bacterium]